MIFHMNSLPFRQIRIVCLAALVLAIIAACSGPESGSNRTSSAELDESTPVAVPTETVDAVSDQPENTSEPDEATAEVDSAATPTEVQAEDEVEPTPTVEPQGEATPTQNQPDPTATIESTPAPEPTPTVEPTPPPPVELEGSLLPGNRIIAYYGHPSTGDMGILGQYSKEELLQVLLEQAAEYEAADPDTPVIPAFELIATVAQPNPQPDGTYLLYTGDDWIQEYVDFTAENNMLLFLDLQIGHSTIRDQIGLIWKWLQYPNVHVAIDPEFATGPDYAPGTIIGGVDGNHINIAIEALSELVLETGLPPKILVVHQFDTQMILNKQDIKPLPGVDFVLHMDGWGTKEAKVANYQHFVRDQLIQYGGIKIFYDQDVPVMTAAEVLQLGPPAPVFISYQ